MGDIYIDQYEFYRFEEGRLYQAFLEQEDSPSLIGAEFIARILRLEKGLEGAMVDMGLPEPGFLPLRSLSKAAALIEGQYIRVQIKRDAFDGKGMRLDLKEATPQLEREGSHMVKPAIPLWERSLVPLDPLQIGNIYCARRVDLEKITAWAASRVPELVEHLDHMPRRDWPDLKEGIQEGLDEGFILPCGANLYFEKARTLNIIDVNSGKAKPQGGMEQLARLVNGEAAHEIPRQISLRNWGGIVIVDFIDLKSAKRRAELVELLKKSAEFDPLIEWIGPMSRLGLVEIKRRRRGKTLSEMFDEEELSRLR